MEMLQVYLYGLYFSISTPMLTKEILHYLHFSFSLSLVKISPDDEQYFCEQVGGSASEWSERVFHSLEMITLLTDEHQCVVLV